MTSYADVVARNVRATMTRQGLKPANVVTRMRALGYETWHRQTMGKVMRSERRVLSEEMLALALALETSIAALMAPAYDDKIVDLPSGETVSVTSVRLSARGFNDGAVRWEGDVPVFVDTTHDLPTPPGPNGFEDHIRRVEEDAARHRAQTEAGQFSDGIDLR